MLFKQKIEFQAAFNSTECALINNLKNFVVPL